MGEGILYGAIFLISFLIYLSILIWTEFYSGKEKKRKGIGIVKSNGERLHIPSCWIVRNGGESGRRY